MKIEEKGCYSKSKWLIDELSADLVQIHGIKRTLRDVTTKYQHAADNKDGHVRNVPGSGR